MYLCYIDEKTVLKYALQQNLNMCLKGRKELVSVTTVCMDLNLCVIMWVLEKILHIQSVVMAPSYR